jgi:hypothetical protein
MATEAAELLTAFINAQIPTAASAKELAERMAAIARLMRATIARTFTDEDKGGTLHQQMEGFKKVLLHDLTQDQFADMYAQTISYGLFAARCNVKSSEHFTRQHAAYNLPKTNPAQDVWAYRRARPLRPNCLGSRRFSRAASSHQHQRDP